MSVGLEAWRSFLSLTEGKVTLQGKCAGAETGTPLSLAFPLSRSLLLSLSLFSMEERKREDHPCKSFSH